MSPDLAQSLLELVVTQLDRLETRAGRRAVRISVAVPPNIDLGHAEALLLSGLKRSRDDTPDLELIESAGRPRLLTVDFELQEAG